MSTNTSQVDDCTCDECNLTFNSLSGYKIHMTKIHDVKEPKTIHACSFCNKQTTDKSNLNKHMKICEENFKKSNKYQDKITQDLIEKHKTEMIDLMAEKTRFVEKYQKEIDGLRDKLKSQEETYKTEFDKLKALNTKLELKIVKYQGNIRTYVSKIDLQTLLIDTLTKQVNDNSNAN